MEPNKRMMEKTGASRLYLAEKLYLSISVLHNMNLSRKHITFFSILLLAAGICLAASTKPKIQNILQENTLTIPVLLVEFEDTRFTLDNPVEKFSVQMARAEEYFNANFQGQRKVSFPITALVTLNSPMAKYGAPSTTFNDTDVRQLVADAYSQAIGYGVDFTVYDTDQNGTIENIAIIFAGYSESEGGSANSIWAHQQSLGNQPIEIGGMKISSYTCTPELNGNTGTTISPIGTFCHEICHFLGLPDMYDTNGETEGLSPALNGTLSIMDKGNRSDNGNTPPYFTSIEREILGIGQVEEIVPGKEYTLLPVNLSGRIYKINTSVEGEYFLVEYRENSGWDKFVGGWGLVVYHVDKSMQMHGGIISAQRWEYNNVNSFAQHPCAKLLTAFNRELEMLSFENGQVQLKDWNGNPVGTALANIRYSDGKVTFTGTEDYFYDESLPRAMECKGHPYQNDAYVEWESPSASSETSGKWIVRWGLKDEVALEKRIIDTSCIWFQDLEPGCQYNVYVRHLQEMALGKETAIKIKTHPITSSFPYIYIDKEGFRSGETAALKIFNLVERHISIQWLINGEVIEGISFTPEQEGEIIIEAVINYYDGSEERIYKRIMVE